MCRILPSTYEQTCMDYVDEFGKMFYEAFLETADVHEMCVLLGLCSEVSMFFRQDVCFLFLLC